MMSIDAIASLVAALALLSLAVSLQHPPQSAAASLHEYQLANDVAETLYKKGSLLQIAQACAEGNGIPQGAQADLARASELSGRCIEIACPAAVSPCASSGQKTSVWRLVPYQGGISSVRVSISLPAAKSYNSG